MKRNASLTLPAALMLASILGACGKVPPVPPLPASKTWSLAVAMPSENETTVDSAVGSVVSDQRVDVASRLSGYIREMRVQEGDPVRRGQVLARLDASDVEGAIRQGQAAVGAAGAAFRDAQADMDRFQRLFDRGSVSENEQRKVRLKLDAARAVLDQARAGLDVATAQRAYAEITSPVDGVVVVRHKQAGDLALPGLPLLTLESGQGLLFETFVAETQLAGLGAGKPVDVSIDGLLEPLKGTVSRVVPSGDPVSRRYQVKIDLPQTAGLMPGMFGRASFVRGENSILLVPRGALVERGGLTGVFVLDAESRARFRWLRIGREWPERVEVNAGLGADERFAAMAEPALRDGDLIKPVEPAR